MPWFRKGLLIDNRLLSALSQETVQPYDLQVPFILTLPADELDRVSEKLRLEQRLTKALPKDRRNGYGPPMVLVLSTPAGSAGQSTSGEDAAGRSRMLKWLGVVAQHGTVGAVDASITVDPLRECLRPVVLDGHDGLLELLPSHIRDAFDRAVVTNSVGVCDREVWGALQGALRERHPELASLLDWLIAQADPPRLDINNPAERSWLEQQDALRNISRIAGLPPSSLASWQRPASDGAPYLAGLIPEPVENGLIDHDIRIAGEPFGMYAEWQGSTRTRCDVHILRDASGRRQLEIANVNATPVEAALGTDMIYYHEPTRSFVLVQYKRLDPKSKSIRVDDRLMGQLDRLQDVASLSRQPTAPDEWRMGGDACFLKLALWPSDTVDKPVDGLVPGMYLPLSYVRLLLNDDCTLGSRGGRQLGYEQVERHLVGTQFVELIKHGLAGTVGTTVESLRDLVDRRLADRRAVMLASERGSESSKERQTRARSRKPSPKGYDHFRQEPLFGPAPEGS